MPDRVPRPPLHGNGESNQPVAQSPPGFRITNPVRIGGHQKSSGPITFINPIERVLGAQQCNPGSDPCLCIRTYNAACIEFDHHECGLLSKPGRVAGQQALALDPHRPDYPATQTARDLPFGSRSNTCPIEAPGGTSNAT